MSKRVRDYLLIIFVVLFVVLTVSISLYASGYKMNLSWPVKFNKLLIKTGMLVIDTTPNGAVIYLNDKPQKTSGFQLKKRNQLTTPNKIKNVLPGEYNLHLEKESYWPVKKRIKINSGQTTFVEDITLFKIDLPMQIAASSVGRLEMSPNYKYLFLPTDKKIINLKNNQEIILDFELISNWQWIKNGDRLLINGLLINPEDGNSIIDYSQTIGTGASDWFWDENNNHLYYRHKDSLNRLEIDNKTNTTIASGENYLDYQPRDDKIFLIVKNDEVKLREYSLKDNEVKKEIKIPEIGSYRFILDNKKWLSLYDEKNESLYLFHPEQINQDNIVIKNIKTWRWLNDDQLIYHNDFEIYLLDLKQNNTTLITRIGEEIEEMIYNNSDNYLIFSTMKSLNVVDLRNDNITTLFRSENISSPTLNKKNDTLYFTAQIGQQKGIYKILVR